MGKTPYFLFLKLFVMLSIERFIARLEASVFWQTDPSFVRMTACS